MTSNTGGPLSGVRVIDLTTVLMGPFATQILGDYGADVIKVEPPGGDGVRGVGPRKNAGMAAIFMHANRSKRSVVLDLKQPAGIAVLMHLVADADVLIYNVRPQAMARLGLSYEAVRAVNSRIVYVGCVGYGQSGPYAAKPAYDDLIQGAAGIPALSVQAGSDVPRYAPSPLADRIVGLAAVNAVTSALFWRERSGEGQAVEVPMFETMAQFTLSDHMCGRSYEPAVGPSGYARILNPNRRPYATSDGYLCVLLYNDKQWQTFFRLIGKPEVFETDPRFSSIDKRTEHIHALYALLAEIMTTRTTAQWTALLEAADIPVMPMHDMDSLMEDPHLQAVGFLQQVEHPTEGRVCQIGIPSTWSKTQPRVSRPAPRAGEHGREVLAEAGFTDAEIDALLVSGVTAMPSTSKAQD
ncbi:CoA transferase [Diaphorobacter sp. HDW4A]|uniref:CaiB/BaiF CoA transferase family protein n=1 Tax=Diaphorobacter sp. HDW4A TaxID=2714924 RepID=UPI00140A7739|nr:CoA transferase [Diaphorobacter sp. HDW4A]QIL80232.1 CoA transferase [Diaphorobacter sp. HDW4A]